MRQRSLSTLWRVLIGGEKKQAEFARSECCELS